MRNAHLKEDPIEQPNHADKNCAQCYKQYSMNMTFDKVLN